MIFQKNIARIRIYIKSLNKIKVFKMGCQKTFYQITKTEKQTIKNKTDKNWKKTWNNLLFWV